MSNQTTYTKEYLNNIKDRSKNTQGLEFLKDMTDEELVSELKRNEERDENSYEQEINMTPERIAGLDNGINGTIQKLKDNPTQEDLKDAYYVIIDQNQPNAKSKYGYVMRKSQQQEIISLIISNITRNNNEDMRDLIFYPGDELLNNITKAQELLLESAINQPGRSLRYYAYDLLVNQQSEKHLFSNETVDKLFAIILSTGDMQDVAHLIAIETKQAQLGNPLSEEQKNKVRFFIIKQVHITFEKICKQITMSDEDKKELKEKYYKKMNEGMESEEFKNLSNAELLKKLQAEMT